MSFLLDTCALSELTRGAPNPGVAAWFEARAATDLFVSVMTIGEIERGVAQLPTGKKRNALAGWLRALQVTYAERVLGIDAAIAVLWGRMTATAHATGRNLGVVDGLIAATAAHRGLTVVTRNVGDFSGTGAQMTNPWV